MAKLAFTKVTAVGIGIIVISKNFVVCISVKPLPIVLQYLLNRVIFPTPPK